MLPNHATLASRRRFELAQHIANACPPKLGELIAITGSSARGYAHDTSDFELNFWTKTLPTESERVVWLESIGAHDLAVEAAAHKDDSYWLQGSIDEIACEFGWQTISTLEAFVRDLLAGANVTSHGLLVGELITSAIPLRDDGRLEALQIALRAYPDATQRAVIGTALDILTAEPLTDAQRAAAISIAFAGLHCWQPSPKAARTLTDQLDQEWRARLIKLLD